MDDYDTDDEGFIIPKTPCPWCFTKETAMVESEDDDEIPTFSILCLNCSALGPEAHSPEEALRKWDREDNIGAVKH